jgi:hypothetical protein
MVDKNKNKKKKTYKKKYTSVRDDYRKGGRVSYQQGGLEKPKRELEGTTQDPKKRQPISIQRPVEEIVKRPDVIQPTQQTTTTSEKPISTEDTTKYYKKFIDDTPLGKATGVPNVVGVGRTGFERDNNKRPPDEITSIERIPNEEDLERERLAEERRRAAEEAVLKQYSLLLLNKLHKQELQLHKLQNKYKLHKWKQLWYLLMLK